jgi:hypothetical protein
MIPILATSAASIAGEIYDDLTTKSASSTAQSATQPTDGVNFSALLPTGAPHSARQVASTQSLQDAASLFSQLTKGTDAAAAANSFGV